LSTAHTVPPIRQTLSPSRNHADFHPGDVQEYA